MSFVELPSSTQLAVISVVSTLVALGVTVLIAYAPFLSWLEPFKEQWGAAAGLVALEWLQNVLPGQYPEASILAVQLVLAVIVIYTGLKIYITNRGARKLV